MKRIMAVILLAIIFTVTGSNFSYAEPTDQTIFTADSIILVTDTTYDFQNIVIDGCVLTIDGSHTFNDLSIVNGGSIIHSNGIEGMELVINGNLDIDGTSSINLDGKGYGASAGPGQGIDGASGGGAGYGGTGGAGTVAGGPAYGSFDQPQDLGSGGGNGTYGTGGRGGGAVSITVSGELTLNGEITSNGLAGSGYKPPMGTARGAGGGSGGSIRIETNLLSGTGLISANGGSGSYYAGGGSGGRIALDYKEYSFDGAISIKGGAGQNYGELGTFWVGSSPIELNTFQDFETTWDGWYADNGLWQVGMPTADPGGAYSGTNAADTVLDGTVPARSVSRFISPIMMIPGSSVSDRILMRYWQWYHFENGSGSFQIALKQSDGTWSDWADLEQTAYTGESEGWKRAWADISGYTGKTVRLAFLYAGGTLPCAGWTIDDIELDIFSPPPLTDGIVQKGSIGSTSEQDYYVIQVPAGGYLMLTLDDLDDIGANEVYIKHGSLPTAGDYDYKFSDFGSADQTIYVAGATPGYWFIMVTGSDVPPDGSDYTLLVEHETGVILDLVTPDHYGAADAVRLTIEGAGFTPGAVVELVQSGSVAATAENVEYFSGARIAADFDFTGLVTGNDYVVRVRGDDSTGELPFTIVEPLPAELKINMVLPSSVGYHRPATIWVEYENTGQVAMKTPLLVVGAKQGEREAAILTTPQIIPLTGAFQAPQVRGFWTSSMPEGYANTVQFLASGEVPGLLQPGEKGRFPVYWAGWQQPWSFSYPPINFTLGVVEDSNDTGINWADMKDDMKPDSIGADTWDALWQAFTAEAGDTWGTYVKMLQDNAVYLGRQGLHINDIGDLLAFEFAQADGMNVVRTLASSMDAHVVAPGLNITFSRTYGQSISRRHMLGDLGYGWSHNWDYFLEFETDGTVRMKGPGGSRRTYQPDSRAGYPYFSMEGDHAVLVLSGGGYLHTESSGYVRFFDASGKLEYVEDPQGNRITCTYSGDQLIGLEHSSGQYLDIDWNGDQISSVTDPDGRVTSYSYGSGGDYLTGALFYDGSLVSYSYETSGTPATQHAILSITFPGNTHQYFNWDANGRLAGISRDNNAEPVTFNYGDAGEVFIKDVFGHTNSYFMNHNGVLVRAEDPQGHEINLKYDLNYNLASVIDPEGRSYSYDYDKNGNMTRMTDPLGYVTPAILNLAGHLKKWRQSIQFLIIL